MIGFVFKRLLPLLAGFVIWGLAVALMVRSKLGLSPWDVFHQGFGNHLGISIGQAGVVTSLAVLLLWIPLKMKPGVGTLLNAGVIGPAADFFLWLIPPVEDFGLRVAFLVIALLATGLGSALYLPARLGAGPRDGLMVGLNKRFGFSIRLSRSMVEIAAFITGWLLGGTIGIGTVVTALGLGPIVQASLHLRRRLVEHLTGVPQSAL